MNSIYALLVHLIYSFSIIITVVGLLILIMPSRVLRLSNRLNLWIDTDKWFDALEKRQQSERLFYRHHRLFGLFITLGSVFIFYTFVFRLRPENTSIQSFVIYSTAVTEWLLSSLVFLMSFASMIFCIIGLLVFFRPSYLKGMEKELNKWINNLKK